MFNVAVGRSQGHHPGMPVGRDVPTRTFCQKIRRRPRRIDRLGVFDAVRVFFVNENKNSLGIGWWIWVNFRRRKILLGNIQGIFGYNRLGLAHVVTAPRKAGQQISEAVLQCEW